MKLECAQEGKCFLRESNTPRLLPALKCEMNSALGQTIPRKLTPFKAFVSVFTAILLVMLLGTALVTFIMPESFVGIARVRTSTPEQSQIFESKDVLAVVVEKLDLNRRFAQRYGQSEPLALVRTLGLIQRETQVIHLRNTELTEIRAYSRIPVEAAELANAIAETGITNAVYTRVQAHNDTPLIIDQAVPGLRPVRPNKTLNFTLGALVGTVLGIMAGGVGARLAFGYSRQNRPEAANPGNM
jgi:uncharacterized protein involved in exopolysaccharide biosynthesis